MLILEPFPVWLSSAGPGYRQRIMQLKPLLDDHADLPLGRSAVKAWLPLLYWQVLRLVEDAPAFPTGHGGGELVCWRISGLRADILPHLRLHSVVMVAAHQPPSPSGLRCS